MMRSKVIAVCLCMIMIFMTIGCGEEARRIPEDVPMTDNYRTYYEVFVYSFYDGDGDGIGDFKGLTEKLDYINDGKPEPGEDLGCNGIWLMPIMPSPTYHKYDVTDYYSIDPQYGTMEDFELFMEECNQRGIKVILDLVMNHTSSQHPWFLEACNYLNTLGEKEPSLEECPYVDYYHFSKEQKAGYCPVPGSDTWYYEAQFYYGMPDLNLFNEELQREFEKIVEFWLNKGVGGFRIDAAKEFVSGSPTSNTEILAWITNMVKSKREDAYLVAEVWTDLNTYAGYYASGIDSIFNFAFADNSGVIANAVKGVSPASGFGEALVMADELFQENNPNYIDAPFYTNHDLGRSAGYYAGEQSMAQTKVAGALNLLMSGNVFLYYGEELGMKGAGKDENKRAPMYFSSDKNAPGMCDGPADMDDVKMKFPSYEEQKEDAYSVYRYYQQAIYLRNLYPAIRKGTVENLPGYATNTVAAIRKSYENETLIILCNLSTEKQVVDLSDSTNQIKGIENALYVGEEIAVYEKGQLELPAYGIVLMEVK
ncbi:MAG: alpha-amylase [Lachnospiraceae bacterium]|nr:alpha-amylase [Lachnospiraceae bacterium]